nr:hypothetical protein [Ktedonobacterales bacterium]
ANFTPLDRADVRSPDVRRFFERLLLRFIEVNPVLTRPQFARRLPEARSAVPRVAAEIQRGLVELAERGSATFGARRPTRSWTGQARHAAPLPEEELAYNTGVLQATLSRSHQAVASPRAHAPTGGPHTDRATDATVPVPSQGDFGRSGDASYGIPPSAAHAHEISTPTSIERYPTQPVPSASSSAAAAPPRNGHDASANAHELPPDLYRLYGDYLNDMQPDQRPGYTAPAPPATSPPSSHPGDAQGARTDGLIFGQLRYQLEAYVRRAARSYGLPNREGDPARVMDALRHSALVDEADLRIAEGILALTDRVAAQGHATLEDYRQAFMLYLLYHRSHLGA